MRHIFILTAVCGLFFFSACKKNSPASTRAQFKWTYSGATFTADTVLATKGDSMFGIYYPPQIYAQTGPWDTPATAFTANISSFSPGSYGDGGMNNFSEYQSAIGNNWISPFSVTISSYANNKINGNFTGTLNGQTITGTFSNVAVH